MTMKFDKQTLSWFSGIFCTVVAICWHLKKSRKTKDPLPASDKYHSSISIPSAGGFDRLCLTDCKYACLGANIPNTKPGIHQEIPSFLIEKNQLDFNQNYALIEVHSIGISYADCCIRWGLYDAAKEYVGWPITPGFEFSGRIVELYGNNHHQFKQNDLVFGVTLFGAYSTHLLVPLEQIFLKPSNITMEEAGGFLCTAITAYYALFELADPTSLPPIQKSLVNYYNSNPSKSNQIEFIRKPMKYVLIHSASGGVGSMLVQMCKQVAKYDIVVGVVGGKHKISLAKNLGCDYVIDRNEHKDIWKYMKEIIPGFKGFDLIFDANGVSTLKNDYKHLKSIGKLVIYGFHSMFPHSEKINIWQLIQIIISALRTPSFSAVNLCVDNKLVAGFDLSFLFNRMDLLPIVMTNLLTWIEQDLIKVGQITTYKMEQVGQAHKDIQTGNTVGKLVLVTPNGENMKC